MVTYRVLFCLKRLPWSDTGRHERSRKREGRPFIKKGLQKNDRFINMPPVTACVATSKLTLLTARMIAPTSIHGHVCITLRTQRDRNFLLARYSRVISIRARSLCLCETNHLLCVTRARTFIATGCIIKLFGMTFAVTCSTTIDKSMDVAP